MKNFVIALLVLTTVFGACTGKKRNKMVEDIKTMEKNGEEYNQQYIDSLNALYNDFVTAYPKDSLAPVYLLKWCQSAYTRGTQDEKQLDKAIVGLKKLLNNYPNDKETEAGIFLMANIYENNKSDTVKAKEYYVMYLDKFPNGVYAESVRTILAGNLGMSADDWMKKFQMEGKLDSNVYVK